MSQEDKVTLVAFNLEQCDALDGVTDLVQMRLVDCGWREEVRLACRNAIADIGDKNITVDELISRVTANARSMVPSAVKGELLYELENIMVTVDKVNMDQPKK